MKESVQMRHPASDGTHSPQANFSEVYIGPLTFWFSYSTCIAFAVPGIGRRVCENVWSKTTGRHLNSIDGGDKDSRISRPQFEAELADLFARVGAALEPLRVREQ